MTSSNASCLIYIGEKKANAISMHKLKASQSATKYMCFQTYAAIS